MIAADRGHMLALAARTMRRILIDEARKAGAAKRHAPTLDDAVARIAHHARGPCRSRRGAQRLAEFLGRPRDHRGDAVRTLGLTVEETARQTGIPERTVKRRWQVARAWLHDYLQTGDDVRVG